MKKSLKLFGVITLVVVIVITVASCSKSGGGKILNSVEDLKAYLDSQPANSKEKPIKIAMKLNETMFPKVRDVINEAGKYGSLDLSGSPITTIPEHAFVDFDIEECFLAGITIPDSVTSIGEAAFFECTNLTGVTIGSGVTSIGDYAFQECTSLTSITIPKGVINIGDGVFLECTSLTKVIIPNSVTSIGAGAFSDCTSLTSVVIPDSVTIIGNGTFSDCTSLAKVIIPKSVTGIGDGAFFNCISLTNVNIPDSVTGIGTAFVNCPNLYSVTFQGKLDGLYLNRYSFGFLDKNNKPHYNDLPDKYLAGGPGTYTTTAPVNENSKWTKQSVIGNKSTSEKKSSGKVSAFPGRWHLVEGSSDAENVELFKDGSGTADGNGITWKVENGRFHILHPYYTFSAYYNITGSTVTFTDDDGEVTKYQKK